ncbi:MAG TPA: hypothetical protein VEI81_08370, partial [Methanoregula sp.]|nr:hypothetical protein [Methanoregula sp.]
MELPGMQTWIVFYLISFVMLLWAAFLSASGTMLWVSLFLVIIIIGVNFVTVLGEVKKHALRRELQRSLTKDLDHNKEKKG